MIRATFFHWSLLRSIPVGLCAHAWRTITLPSGADDISSNKPSMSRHKFFRSQYRYSFTENPSWVKIPRWLAITSYEFNRANLRQLGLEIYAVLYLRIRLRNRAARNTAPLPPIVWTPPALKIRVRTGHDAYRFWLICGMVLAKHQTDTWVTEIWPANYGKIIFTQRIVIGHPYFHFLDNGYFDWLSIGITVY